MEAAKKLSVARPLPPPRSLAHELITRLTADITSGNIPPGARLPTEQELIAATGVSRTVVREAVAALRAEGLVVTRQGVGAFVPENARRPFRVDFGRLSSIREVLEVMELRTGIEIEAGKYFPAAAHAPQLSSGEPHGSLSQPSEIFGYHVRIFGSRNAVARSSLWRCSDSSLPSPRSH